MKELDPFTYGNSPAAVTLTKILNEYPYCIKFVSKTYGDYTLGMRHIEKMESPIKYSIMTLWKDNCLCIINGNKRIPDKIKSYLTNIIVAKFRIMMREHVQDVRENQSRKDKEKNNELG